MWLWPPLGSCTGDQTKKESMCFTRKALMSRCPDQDETMHKATKSINICNYITHQCNAMRPDLVGPEAIGDDGLILTQEFLQLLHSEGAGQVLHVDDTGGGVAGGRWGTALHCEGKGLVIPNQSCIQLGGGGGGGGKL